MLNLSNYGDKVAKSHHKQDVFTIRVQILCWTLIILCMHLILHPYFGRTTAGYQNIFTKMSTYTVVLTCIIFLSIMIFYINELFIKQNKRILGIMSINGMTMKQLTRYLIKQGWRLHKQSIPISLCVSFIALPICNYLSNLVLGDSIDIFRYNVHAYMGVLLIFTLVWSFLLIGDLGYIYRSEIRDLLSGEYQRDILLWWKCQQKY